MYHQIVSITKKGQATLPLKLRKKYHLKEKAIVMDTDEGILIKRVTLPSEVKGSLKFLYKNDTSGTILKKMREKDILREKKLLR